MNLRILAIATMLATCLPLRAVASSETGAVDPGMELLAASKDYKLILGTGVDRCSNPDAVISAT